MYDPAPAGANRFAHREVFTCAAADDHPICHTAADYLNPAHINIVQLLLVHTKV